VDPDAPLVLAIPMLPSAEAEWAALDPLTKQSFCTFFEQFLMGNFQVLRVSFRQAGCRRYKMVLIRAGRALFSMGYCSNFGPNKEDIAFLMGFASCGIADNKEACLS